MSLSQYSILLDVFTITHSDSVTEFIFVFNRIFSCLCCFLFFSTSQWSLTMDEAAEPDNVKVVLAQEFSELLSILANQPTGIIKQLCQRFPKASLTGITHAASPDTALMEAVKTMLDYFTVASAEECCHFLQTVCMLCENIPMCLEAKLMSVSMSWHGNSEYQTMPSLLVLRWGSTYNST